MGRTYWVTSLVAAVAVIFGLNQAIPEQAELVGKPQAARADVVIAQTRREIEKTKRLPIGHNGSALATAAFGMSALQPETYNGDMVASIIAASPLEEVEKVQLTSNLEAAESGKADLHLVLSDVRSALAVE